MGAEVVERPTVRLSNIPQSVIAKDLLQYLETQLGPDSVFAIEISTERKNWKSRGFGRVQFTSLEFKEKTQSLSIQNKLFLKSQYLMVSETYDDIIPRPIRPQHRLENCVLYAGFMKEERCLCVLESWDGVRGWLMPERRRVEFWVWVNDECYKLDVRFDDVLEAVGCCLGGEKVDAILLKVWL